METKSYKTQTGFINTNNPSVEGVWPVAIDVGYSAVKGYSKNRIFSFPTFIRKTNTSEVVFDYLERGDIQYRDETGAEYDVGNRAIMISNDGDLYGSDKVLYGRDRYTTDTFKVCVRVALGVSLASNKYGKHNGEPIVVQTGLPNDYSSDAAKLKAAFAGHHVFDIRFDGIKEWQHFDFTIDENNVLVIAQPMGSFWCSLYDAVGKPIEDRKKLAGQNTCIFDGGFGTLDIFSIKRMTIEKSTTHEDCGMRAVFKETSDEIMSKYGVDIPVPYMQKYLETGKFTHMVPTNKGVPINELDPSTFKTVEVDFTDILEKNSHKVALKSLSFLSQETQRLKEFDNLILTGGSGTAWQGYIAPIVESWGKKVIIASDNEGISAIFNNVRGYYMALYKNLCNQRKVGK